MTDIHTFKPADGPSGPVGAADGDTSVSDQRFRAAFDNASIGMAITDRSGLLLTCNEALCRMLGYDREEIEGHHFSEVTHVDDRELSIDQLRRLVSREIDATKMEKRYIHRNGDTVWARVSVASIFDTSGRVLHFVSQIEDITAQRQAEAAAAASDEQFRLTFESAASGLALVDPRNGRFIRVNDSGCQMLGYSEEELQELTIQDVTAPGDREESFARFRSVIAGEIPSSQAKLHYLRSDGSTAHSIVSTALVRDSAGQPMHLVANVVDISEQVRAQDQLEAAVASKDQLIASVSHELRTPLTAILGFAEVLRSDSETLATEESVELIQSIANQTADLTNIVEDLLVAARADNQTLTVARVPVNLRAQAAQVLETMGNERGAEIDLGGVVTRGWGDPARVRQILRNLISNAFRYGGGTIEVVTYDRDSSSCVAVIDNGAGVPEEEREHIFEPYQRAPHAQEVAASMGLGLTVSRKLAKLMEGSLTYEYEAGKSIFEFALVPVDD